jgi:hypothetical protein
LTSRLARSIAVMAAPRRLGSWFLRGVVSSWAAACPLGGPAGAQRPRRTGQAVEPEPTLGEDEDATHPRRGLTRILALTGARHTTAVCAPGTLIRHLVAALAGRRR